MPLFLLLKLRELQKLLARQLARSLAPLEIGDALVHQCRGFRIVGIETRFVAIVYRCRGTCVAARRYQLRKLCKLGVGQLARSLAPLEIGDALVHFGHGCRRELRKLCKLGVCQLARSLAALEIGHARIHNGRDCSLPGVKARVSGPHPVRLFRSREANIPAGDANAFGFGLWVIGYMYEDG